MKFKKSISMALILSMVTTLVPLTFRGTSAKAASQLIINGGFETTGGGGNSKYWTNPSVIAPSWTASTMPSTPAANSPMISVVNDIVHSGSNALKIAPPSADPANTTRLFLGQVINLPAGSAGKKFRASVWMKTESVTGNTIGFRFQKYTGKDASGTQIKSADVSKSGTMDWTLVNNDQIIDDTCQSVKISIIHGTSAAAQGTAWVDDINLQEIIDNITLPESTISLAAGSSYTLAPSYTPAAATKDMLWTSSDSSVAAVDNNGVISTLKVGTSRITGTSSVDPTKTVFCDVNVVGVPVEGITLDKDNVNIDMGGTSTITAIIAPGNASDKTVLWSSDNTSVASVDNNGVITGLKPGTATITATSNSDSSKKAACTVNVNGLVLDKSSATVSNGKDVLLTAAVMPKINLVWESSNNDIATVQDGLVKTIKPGSAVITVKTEDNKYTASFNLTVEPYTSDEFDSLRVKYAATLLGGNNYDINDPATKALVDSIAASAQSFWSSMDPTGTYLWSDIPGIVQGGAKRKTSEVTTNYNRLLTMAKAYLMEGSSLKGNTQLLRDTLRGLEWMNKNLYNSSITLPMFVGDNGTGDGNWYAFVIGSPKVLNNLVSMLYDYLSDDEVNRYEMAVRNFVSDPTWYMDSYGRRVTSTGGNLSDTCKVAVVNGINTKDADFIAAGRDALSGNFKLVSSGEGIYRDGSFIQHVFVPYNNTYGQVLLQGIGDILSILSGSSWQIKDPSINNIYNWLEIGIAPLMYKGSAMDMASGRAISRGGYQDHDIGASLINVFIQFSQFTPEPYASKFKSLVKYWIQQDTYRDYVNNCTDIILKSQVLDILNDPSIAPASELTGQFNYPSMDRVVHRDPLYSIAISMYSKRVSNYETMNGENLKGWHTSDGMTYLYNGDLGNFANDYWATVDPYRLPGTTVDKLPQPTAANDQTASKITSPQSWVGGTSLGSYGTAGMFLDKLYMNSTGTITNKLNMNLQAKKSWFMFGKEVVALGAGINSTDNRTIETIVDNRKISDTGDNKLTVDGNVKLNNLGDSEVMSNVKWMHLAGSMPNSDVGYYFPGGENINALREARTGAWSDININGSKTPITRNYVTTWLDHGANPNNAEYSYVLLPGMSANEVEQYSKNADVTILSNTPDVQAAKKNSLNLLAANFWNDAVQTVDYITVNKKASILSQKTDGYLDISVSDPTMMNTGTIEIDINEPNLVPEKLDSRIVVTASGDKTHISVDVNNAAGKAIIGKFRKSVTGITLDKTSADMNIGDTISLKASVVPADAANQSVVWTSSDNSVAAVDANGTVKALKQGTADITAASQDGGFTALCKVTVIKPYEYQGELIDNTLNKIVEVIKNTTLKTVFVDAAKNKKAEKALFEAIKNIDKSITFIQDKIQWTFNGKDINGDIKDIDLSVNIAPLKNTNSHNKAAIGEKVNGSEALVISFAENGKLPGTAKVKVKLDSNWLSGKDKNNLFVYYYNEAENKIELIDKNLRVDENGYIEFSITHNSDYFVVDKEIQAAINNTSNAVTDKKSETIIDKKSDTSSTLPKTGSLVDYKLAQAIGVISILIGSLFIIIENKRKKSC